MFDANDGEDDRAFQDPRRENDSKDGHEQRERERERV